MSPLLGRRLGAGLSAGRVQSPALRLVVDREPESQAFEPQSYWEVVVAARSSRGDLIEFEVAGDGVAGAAARGGGDRTFRFPDEAVARVVERVRSAGSGVVRSVRSDEEVRKPPAPFSTSTLQQAAAVRLKLGVAETMEVAQRLYEAGRITYMRTDSTALSAEAVEALRGVIADKWGEEALPSAPVAHASGAQAQEAHEAIRPAEAARCVAGDGDLADRVYDLVRRRALASQMCDVVLRRTRVRAESASVNLRARGTVVSQSGWHAAWPPQEQEERLLPPIEEGDELVVESVKAVRKRTKAPKHFTEASLVREFEKRGIGRPSTYAATLKTLAVREYVVVRRRDLLATEKGCSVVDWLGQAFPGAPRLRVHGSAGGAARSDCEGRRGLEAAAGCIRQRPAETVVGRAGRGRRRGAVMTGGEKVVGCIALFVAMGLVLYMGTAYLNSEGSSARGVLAPSGRRSGGSVRARWR